MNQFEMVVLIVAIMAVMGVMRARYGAGRRMRRRGGWQDEGQVDDPEKTMLRQEVRELKDRVAVLERIITDRSSTLEHEIEQLRDR